MEQLAYDRVWDKRVPKPQVRGSTPGIGYIFTFEFYMANWVGQKGSEARGCGSNSSIGYDFHILFRKVYQKCTYFVIPNALTSRGLETQHKPCFQRFHTKKIHRNTFFQT